MVRIDPKKIGLTEKERRLATRWLENKVENEPNTGFFSFVFNRHMRVLLSEKVRSQAKYGPLNGM